MTEFDGTKPTPECQAILDRLDSFSGPIEITMDEYNKLQSSASPIIWHNMIFWGQHDPVAMYKGRTIDVRYT